MSKEPEKLEITLSLTGIRPLKETIIARQILSEDGAYEYTFTTKMGYNKSSEDILGLILNVLFYEKEGKVHCAELEYEFDFNVLNLQKIISTDKKTNKVSIPNELLDLVIGLSYTTMRGIFYKSVKDFGYPCILPIITPAQFRTGKSALE